MTETVDRQLRTRAYSCWLSSPLRKRGIFCTPEPTGAQAETAALLRAYGGLLARPYNEVMRNGATGNATSATAAGGQHILDGAARRLVEIIDRRAPARGNGGGGIAMAADMAPNSAMARSAPSGMSTTTRSCRPMPARLSAAAKALTLRQRAAKLTVGLPGTTSAGACGVRSDQNASASGTE